MSQLAPRHGAVLALTLAAASWGIGTVISKRAVAEIPPHALLPIQLIASVATLAVVGRFRRGPLSGRTASRTLRRLGILNPGIAYALSLLGLTQITASLSVLIWALEPMLILVLARWFLGERLGWGLAVTSLAALAGVLLVVYDPTSSGRWLGVALTIAGVACCAVYTVVARRWIGSEASTIDVVAGQQAYALGFAAVAFIAATALGATWTAGVSAAGWASAAASGVLYYGVAYWLYLGGLRHLPASHAAGSFYLVPVFGVAGGIALLGEGFDARQWFGAGIVLVAVAVISWRAIREPAGA